MEIEKQLRSVIEKLEGLELDAWEAMEVERIIATLNAMIQELARAAEKAMIQKLVANKGKKPQPTNEILVNYPGQKITFTIEIDDSTPPGKKAFAELNEWARNVAAVKGILCASWRRKPEEAS